MRLHSTCRDGRAVVEVTDEGDGMPPEIVERVTERFFRADPSRSRQRGGSGLGMAIVDAAMAAHGGAIDITSTPGHGTTVRLSFPPAALVGPPPLAPDVEPTAAERASEPARIPG